jgi:hypothetical protein
MKDHEAVNRGIHIRRAQKSPRATMETRMALIVAERGAKYFVPYRKGAKPRFDHWRFAKDQNISTDWLFDGDIRAYPKFERRAPAQAAKPRAVPRRRGRPAEPRQCEASAQRSELIEMARSLDDWKQTLLLDYLRRLTDDGGAA